MAVADFRGFEAYFGGNSYDFLSGAGPFMVKNGGGRICRLVNTSTTAQTATISVYDCATTSSLSNLLFSVVLGASQIVDLQLPFYNGLVITTTASLTNPVVVTSR